MLSYQIISFTYFPSLIIPLTVLYIIVCTELINKQRNDIILTINPINSKLFKIIGTCISGSLLSCSLYSYYHWNQAILYYYQNDVYAKSHDSSTHCKPFLKENGRFLISIAELYQKEDSLEQCFKYMKLAEPYYSDITFYHNLAMLYEEKNKLDKAEKLLKQAAYMTKKNERITYSLICYLLRIGKKDEAYSYAILLLQKLQSSPKRSTQYKHIIIHLNEIINRTP